MVSWASGINSWVTSMVSLEDWLSGISDWGSMVDLGDWGSCVDWSGVDLGDCWSRSIYYGVESVDWISGVGNGTDGTIGLDKGVLSLDNISVSAFLVVLGISGQTIGNGVSVVVLWVCIIRLRGNGNLGDWGSSVNWSSVVDLGDWSSVLGIGWLSVCVLCVCDGLDCSWSSVGNSQNGEE